MRRALIGELMDDPALDVGEHRRALAALDRIHRVSLTGWYLAAAVEGVLARAERGGGEPVTLLDVACGGGAVGIDLARRLERRGRAVRLIGCDLSPTALRRGREAADREGLAWHRWLAMDATTGALPRCDVAVCGLFLHHLADADAAAVLAAMGRSARVGGVVLDLLRSRRGYAMVWLAMRVLTRSRVVHVDGPRSVRAAFTADELAGLAERAGLSGAAVRRVFGQRAVVTWGGGARVNGDA